MDKLAKEAFNQKYRFRNSRGGSGSGAARCQLCIHFQDGYCVHPNRKRRVILSEAPIIRGHYRYDLSAKKVCDCVEIPIPAGIEVPQLAEKHAVCIHGGTKAPFNHGDARCAYVAAAITDKGWMEFGNHITTHSYEDAVRVYHCCELPGCLAKIGVPLGVRDQYMTHQGFADVSVPLPPNPVVPDDPQEEPMSLSLEELAELLKPILYPFGDQPWPREARIAGVRTIGLLANHQALYQSPNNNKSGISQNQLVMALGFLGWGPIVGWNHEEAAGFHGHPLEALPWTDELSGLAVRYLRLSSRLPCFEAAEGGEGVKAQPRMEWYQWNVILNAVGWQPVAQRINFLVNVLYKGLVVCPRCESNDKPEYRFGPRFNRWPVRHGSQAICPECRCNLVNSDYLTQKYRT